MQSSASFPSDDVAFYLHLAVLLLLFDDDNICSILRIVYYHQRWIFKLDSLLWRRSQKSDKIKMVNIAALTKSRAISSAAALEELKGCVMEES